MKKVIRVIFEYEDGSMEQIADPRTAMVFQSRCNSSGIFAGMYNAFEPLEQNKEEKEIVETDNN